MSSIRLATAGNVRAFQGLTQALDTNDNDYAKSIDREALEDEIGRFRVWSGNLGALQKGHSSLDYRLRDSPLLSSNALKFLKELEVNLREACAVVCGTRLPYEEQAKAGKSEDDQDEDDDFFDEDEDEDDDSESGSRTELSMRFAEVVDIIDNLYKLSVRIRTPTIRSRSLKAAAYNPKDPETGIDLLSTYASYDVQHVKELLEHLRRPYTSEGGDIEYDYLVLRLSAAITTRRRQFKYWKRHRDKLGAATVMEEQLPEVPRPQRGEPQRTDTMEALPDIPIAIPPKQAQSQRTGRTMLSGTEATQHHQSLDEIVDSKSVTSYAVTVKDVHGKGVDLPPPPRAADGEKDFECPYCYIICPARYGRGRAWRTHLLQDLQPYICTYPNCDSAEQLFRSRREWAAHEATHRKVWRCPEHPSAIFKTQGGLEGHLRQEHLDSFPETQLPTMVKVGETTAIDTRPKCPICFASAGLDELGDFHNHIANHLERIATFALPSGMEGDEDGASNVPSRGRSESSESRGIDGSLPTDSSDESLRGRDVASLESEPALQKVGRSAPGRTFLSAESLQDLPDGSQDRLNTLFASRSGAEEPRDPEQGQSDIDLSPEEEDMTDEMKTNREQREEFRTYLGSFPGCEKIWFYRKHGSWTGQANFESEILALEALKDFDEQRFPLLRIHQNDRISTVLNFMTTKRKKGKGVQSPPDVIVEPEQVEEVTPGLSEKDNNQSHAKLDRVLDVSEMPTLSSMYRTRKLGQRDQSVAPNASYNHIISFCYYDITKLRVGAIVNSSNRAMHVTSGDTLNNAIHKGAGPELARETKAHGKLGSDPVLTAAYNLPCDHIIHVNRPGYSNSNSTGQFNQLRDCYRNSLKTASLNNVTTIAFPCLGTGNVGFPSKVAARIALQEVREYLDATPEHLFQRIVFCVYAAADEKAYMDFLPVYFPPTHGDMDIARSSVWSEDRAVLVMKVLDTRAEVQKVFGDLDNTFNMTIPDFNQAIFSEIAAIDSNLASIRNFLLWSDDANTSIRDLKLACSVMHAVCGQVNEITQLAKDIGDTDTRSHKSIWDDYTADLRIRHGTDLFSFLKTCREFVGCLDDIITRGDKEIPEMAFMREQIEAFKAKRKVEQDNQLNAFDEVLYLREFQREAADAPIRGIVKLNQIPSLAQLYKLDELQEKPTMAQPSAMFNHVVCLAREDITKLEVDVLVNSTDIWFASMGTLDRSVFAKGGDEMKSEIQQYVGKAKIGDVKTTPGFKLPAKHVLHVIPPGQYEKTTKTVLRNLYRDILHTAVSLQATSIAIPSIGTGMLNYPRKDAASLAIEEVKRFLETAEPSSLIERIVFVVWSSQDEFIYKSLMPVYFPPLDINVNRALPASKPVKTEDQEAAEKPRRTLFNSVGEALRSVRFGQQPERSRRITANEEHSLIGFEAHAADCDTCKDPKQLYLEGRDLCEPGYNLAQLVLWQMNMGAGQKVYTRPDKNGRTIELEFEDETFPITKKLLEVVERSYSAEDRSRPFVSANRHYAEITRDQALPTNPVAEPQIGTVEDFKKARAYVLVETAPEVFNEIVGHECHLRVQGDRVEAHNSPEDTSSCLFVIYMTANTEVIRHKTTPRITVSHAMIAGSQVESQKLLFRCRSDGECNALLRMLRRTVEYAQSSVEGTRSKRNTSPAGIKANLEQVRSSSTRNALPSGEDYQQWNRRLKEIRDQLSSNKKPSGGLRDLSFKIDRLSEAASSLQSPRDRSAEVNNEDALAILLLDYLKQDLKTRHGSYIGTKFDDIVRGLRMTPAEVEVALKVLAGWDLIHNTVDDRTWVVSDPPEGLTVIPHGPEGRQEILSTSSTQEQNTLKPVPIPGTSVKTNRPLSYLAEWILSHIPYEALVSPEAGLHRDISIKRSVSLDSVENALQEISEKIRWQVGKAPHSRLDPEVIVMGDPTEMYSPWMCIRKTLVDPRIFEKDRVEFEDTEDAVLIHRTLKEGELMQWAERSRNLRDLLDTETIALPTGSIPRADDNKHLQNASSSATPQPAQTSDYALGELNVDPFVSYPQPFGAKWTRIDKKLVDPRVLLDISEPFDDNGNSILLRHVVPRDQIEAWADKSRNLRNWMEASRQDRETRRDAKGKGKLREQKDDEQERLESVLAGDRREDELRYFEGDGDEEI